MVLALGSAQSRRGARGRAGVPERFLTLQFNLRAWTPPPVFDLLQRLGNVAPEEMRRTFNMGIGMVLAVPAGAADAAQSILEAEGEKAFIIGQVVAADRPDAPVEFIP